MEAHANHTRAVPASQPGFGGLIGESAPMHRLYELIAKVSQSSCPVLLLGETGTGKELVARAIHFMGLRHKEVLVPVDCSTLTHTLFESELFGHVKGAFTGADRSNQGLLRTANEGTIFFDEIGELPTRLQAKLLRFLEEKEIKPVGSTERIPVNVRVIAATNRDLEEGVRNGTFRQDLYFRLNVIQIQLSPLRARKVDIPSLIAYFLSKFSGAEQPVRAISADALRRLMSYDWPGNVRELENAIECAVALSPESVLTENDLSSVPGTLTVPHAANGEELVPLKEIERRAIVRAIEKTGGDKLSAARQLGIGKTTLYRKLKAYTRNAKAPTASCK
jgi:two-component system response regulator HydG